MPEVGKDQKKIYSEFWSSSCSPIIQPGSAFRLDIEAFIPCFSFILYLTSFILQESSCFSSFVKVHVKHLKCNKLHNCILSIDVSIKPSYKELEVRGNRILGLYFSTPRFWFSPPCCLNYNAGDKFDTIRNPPLGPHLWLKLSKYFLFMTACWLWLLIVDNERHWQFPLTFQVDCLNACIMCMHGMQNWHSVELCQAIS